MMFVTRLHTRTTLAKRYGVSTSALKLWYPPAGVIPPRKKGGFFKERDVESLDYFYVATRYRNLSFKEYEHQVLPMGGLAEFLLDANELSLKDFLLNPQYVNQEDAIVQEVLRRIGADDSYQSDGFRVESAA